MRNWNDVPERKMADLFPELLYALGLKYDNKLGDRMIKTIDLLATDKSRYFAQPRPIIRKSFTQRSIKENSMKHLFKHNNIKLIVNIACLVTVLPATVEAWVRIEISSAS